MSKLTIYRVAFQPTSNAAVDNLEYYLSTLKPEYTTENLQYQRIRLDSSIKIDLGQEYTTNQKLGNYAKLEQDNRIFYFFITGVSWTAQHTVKIHLALDTINTFKDGLVWSDKTTTIRQHSDRFKVPSSWSSNTSRGMRMYRNIDRFDEGIEPPKIRKKKVEVQDNLLPDLNWYLMYKTAQDLSPDNIANPIACYLFADQSLTLKPQGESAVIIKRSQFDQNIWYYFNSLDNPNGEFRFEYIDEEGFATQKTVKLDTEGDIQVIFHNTLRECEIFITNAKKNTNEKYSLNGTDITFVSGNFFRFSPVDYRAYSSFGVLQKVSAKYNINAGASITTLTLNDIDKTDSRIMKIIKLPYCPVDFKMHSGHVIEFPNWDWYNEGGLLRLRDGTLSKEFLHKIGDVVLDDELVYEIDSPSATDAKKKGAESKLFASEFYTYKFTYDNFSKEIPLEYLKTKTSDNPTDTTLPINFKMTNTVNSNFLFDLNTRFFGITTNEDYEDVLIVNRNNEETIFSNDYINYIRNGYNYDKKANAQAALQDWLGVGANAVGGIAQFALSPFGSLLGKGIKQGVEDYRDLRGRGSSAWNAFFNARIGGGSVISTAREEASNSNQFLAASSILGAINSGVSVANGIVGAIVNQTARERSMQAKLQELSNQASSVAGSDDMDLLNYYNGNRLLNITYGVNEESQQLLTDLFYYTGYSHPGQEIPQFNNRFWFNYVQCAPVFKEESTFVYQEFLSDIKGRFAAGITFYHCHPELVQHYDFEQEYENWESSILNGGSNAKLAAVQGVKYRPGLPSQGGILLMHLPYVFNVNNRYEVRVVKYGGASPETSVFEIRKDIKPTVQLYVADNITSVDFTIVDKNNELNNSDIFTWRKS